MFISDLESLNINVSSQEEKIFIHVTLKLKNEARSSEFGRTAFNVCEVVLEEVSH